MSYPSKPPVLSVKETAIQLLSRRDHGQYELAQKLTLKGYSDEEIEAAIQLCLEYGYLDDMRFAQSQVRQHIYKGHGERRIRQELNQKRVSEAIVSEVMAGIEQDWYELAKATAEKKFKGQIASDPKGYAKQVRFLQYRGFDFDQIRYALSPDDND